MNLKKRKERLARLSAAGTAAGVGVALMQASDAALVGVDLVVNGDFESVDPGITTAYGNALIDGGWATSTGGGVFAYNYGQGYDDRNDLGTVPPGNDPASATDYYFTMNATPGDEMGFQNIDLSSGETLALITSGLALFDVRGFFTNYSSDLEGGRLTLSFYDGDPGLDGTGALQVGSDFTFDDPNLDEWSAVGGTGAIDSNARWARITLGQNPGTGSSGGSDVYADNISFTVIPEPSGALLAGMGSLMLMQRNRSRLKRGVMGS